MCCRNLVFTVTPCLGRRDQDFYAETKLVGAKALYAMPMPDLSALLETLFCSGCIVSGSHVAFPVSCGITILLCFFRLFIEKLPKHRDYKSATIPEKKDAVKVGPSFHWAASPAQEGWRASDHVWEDTAVTLDVLFLASLADVRRL